MLTAIGPAREAQSGVVLFEFSWNTRKIVVGVKGSAVYRTGFRALYGEPITKRRLLDQWYGDSGR